MKIGRWSTTAGSNSATPPDGWPEGQAPSTVNDCAREMMAQIRTMINDISFIDLDHSPTQATSNSFTIPGNVVSFYDIGRRVKAFDATTLYGTVISCSFTTNTGITLRLDSGSLTTSLTSVATSVLGSTNLAVPDNVFKAQNAIVNGQFDVWQIATSFSISGTAGTVTYSADMWSHLSKNTAVLNVGRSERSAAASNVPTLAQCGYVLNNSLTISVSAVETPIATGEYALVGTVVAGATWRNIAQKPFTLSFWAQTNHTGTYCVAFRNSGNNQSYIQEYQISANNTWERKVMTIPESPSSGTWDYSFGAGLQVDFTLASGATFQATGSQWTAMNALATSNQTNFLISAGNTIKFADVRMVEGTSILPMNNRSFKDELELCQRYYQKSYDYGKYAGDGGTAGRFGFNVTAIGNGGYAGHVTFPVSMNVAPSVVYYSDITGLPNRAHDGVSDYTESALQISSFGFNAVNDSGSSKNGIFFHWVAQAQLR